MKKYLLCRPMGGFNDCLNRIYYCLNYCKKFNRILMIDMKYNNGYSINFSDYFFIDDTNIIYDSIVIQKIITENKSTIYPNEITNLYNYKLGYDNNWFYLLEDKKIYTEINLNIEYDEDIVLYNNCGGGTQSLEIFKIIKLKRFIIDEFFNRYNQIPKPYVSIHIRNTDYKLDYDNFYKTNYDKFINKNIFLASDSKIVLDYFNNSNIAYYNFTTLSEKNQPIHSKYTNNDKNIVFIDTICDLLLLALGETFILPVKYYGYTNLAYNLFNNKHLVHNLIE